MRSLKVLESKALRAQPRPGEPRGGGSARESRHGYILREDGLRDLRGKCGLQRETVKLTDCKLDIFM